ncbi:hypothetical protein SKAU_G00079720 [Synaphobranchus kaupii]|uniref:Uncharacterized protein n=1 Tax=Synaphobranchus kaupii TaxID=118154 RepID=A0A9Q1FUA4_SYNKA|nr:hypothetical protein SKAU_G00079720 [Synaphobranchus kaupii]
MSGAFGASRCRDAPRQAGRSRCSVPKVRRSLYGKLCPNQCRKQSPPYASSLWSEESAQQRGAFLHRETRNDNHLGFRCRLLTQKHGGQVYQRAARGDFGKGTGAGRPRANLAPAPSHANSRRQVVRDVARGVNGSVRRRDDRVTGGGGSVERVPKKISPPSDGNRLKSHPAISPAEGLGDCSIDDRTIAFLAQRDELGIKAGVYAAIYSRGARGAVTPCELITELRVAPATLLGGARKPPPSPS